MSWCWCWDCGCSDPGIQPVGMLPFSDETCYTIGGTFFTISVHHARRATWPLAWRLASPPVWSGRRCGMAMRDGLAEPGVDVADNPECIGLLFVHGMG